MHFLIIFAYQQTIIFSVVTLFVLQELYKYNSYFISDELFRKVKISFATNSCPSVFQ